MAQKLSLTQQQKLTQQQQLRLSQTQLLTVKLLEMPLAMLEQEIAGVINDNPALEKDYDEEVETNSEPLDTTAQSDSSNEDDADDIDEIGDRQDELDRALENMGRDDDMSESGGDYDNDRTDMVFGQSESFFDNLMDQMRESDLTEQEQQVMKYLIGSLDNNGFLTKDLDFICEELAIHQYIDISVNELEHVLHVLQSFDPPGIGARDLQECLLLQTERITDKDLKEMMKKVLTRYYDEFMKKHWDRIQASLGISDTRAERLFHELRRLNPKPGSALGETVGHPTGQIAPDFIVDVDEDNNVSFTINEGNMPHLKVSEDFEDDLKRYEKIPAERLSRNDKEALAFYRDKVEHASIYVDALRQRHITMLLCMKEIVKRQHKYFLSGDEADLKPMKLKDIADKTGLDISTISRFSNSKYADTPWGIKPLKSFFNTAFTDDEGEEKSVHEVKQILKQIIDSEDKKHPLSDEALVKKVKEKGFSVARRTIAKYRDSMNIPIARLRK